MKLIILIVSFIFSTIIHAQNDSINFFINQIKQRNLSNATIGYYNVRIGNHFLEFNPSQALLYFINGYNAARVAEVDSLVYESSIGLANAFLNRRIYDSSLQYAKISNSYAQKINDPVLIYDSYKLAGIVCMEKTQLADAKVFFDKAFQISSINFGIPNSSLIYLEMGNYYYKSLDFTKAIAVLKTGELLAQKLKDEYDQMIIYRGLGSVYTYMNRGDSVQYYLFAAKNYFHKTGNLKEEAVVNQKLGIAFGIFHNTEKMEEYLDLAYKQLTSAGNTKGAVNTIMLKANTYFQAYQYSKCLQTLNMAEIAVLKSNINQSIAVFYIYKSALFAIAGDTINSKQYYSKAKKIADEINDPTINQLIMFSRGIVLSTRMKENMGDSLTKQSIDSLKKLVTETTIKSTLENIALNKGVIDSNKKDFQNTYKTLLPGNKPEKSFQSFIDKPDDSTMSIVSNKFLLEMDTKYKVTQKEDSLRSQMLLIELKNKSINTRNWFLTGLGILSLLIFLLFLRSAAQSRKIGRQYDKIQQLQTELKHRTGNFFNTISGMMSIALATTNDKPTLLSLKKRVSTINHLYTTLYSSPSSNQLPFCDLLASLCNDFEDSFGSAKQINIYQQCNADINKEEAIPLSFIITELMTNAMKYAFEKAVSPEIHVDVVGQDDKRVLHVWDNGKGKDESLTPRQGSQGMSIVKSYSKNLQGKFTTWNDSGFHFKMEF